MMRVKLFIDIAIPVRKYCTRVNLGLSFFEVARNGISVHQHQQTSNGPSLGQSHAFFSRLVSDSLAQLNLEDLVRLDWPLVLLSRHPATDNESISSAIDNPMGMPQVQHDQLGEGRILTQLFNLTVTKLQFKKLNRLLLLVSGTSWIDDTR
jgi:hypothetical protein